MTADTPRAENLLQVWRTYDIDARLQAIAPVMALDDEARDVRLRHHRTGGVYDRGEIDQRDAMDRFLHACSILEVGFAAGVLADPARRVAEQLVPILADDKVQLYYGPDRYPLRLPGALLERARSDRVTPDEAFEPTWFANLLALDARFTNAEMEVFLTLADSFRVGGIMLSDLRAVAKDRDAIVEAVVTPPQERSVRQRALAGLERFLFFAGDLDDQIKAAPESGLGDAAFDLYRYWFRSQRSRNLAGVVDDALQALAGEVKDEELPQRRALQALFARASA